jgi:hypothetical protein
VANQVESASGAILKHLIILTSEGTEKCKEAATGIKIKIIKMIKIKKNNKNKI